MKIRKGTQSDKTAEKTIYIKDEIVILTDDVGEIVTLGGDRLPADWDFFVEEETDDQKYKNCIKVMGAMIDGDDLCNSCPLKHDLECNPKNCAASVKKHFGVK